MHKYSVALSVAGAIAIAGFSACGSTSETNGNDGMRQTSGDGGGDGGDAGACTPTQLFNCSEGQITSIANALNQGEIDEAQVAVTSAQSSQVRDFANMMITDHTALQEAGTALASKLGIQPIDNWISRTLTSEADAKVTILSNATQGQNSTSSDAGSAGGDTWGNASDASAASDASTGANSSGSFDETYMSQQILAHLNALALMDQVLIPSATTQDLKSALMDARAHVADHLTRALDIEDSLVGGSCGGDLTSGANVEDAGADARDGGDGGAASDMSDAGAADSGKNEEDSGKATSDAGANPWM
jgi:putative membrane protein